MSFNQTSVDPFNYPMPCRKDLMSLSTITATGDIMKTTTKNFTTTRFQSQNLDSSDITGTFNIPFSILFLLHFW